MIDSKAQRMGNAPMATLLLKMSGPAIVSMLVQATYNFVDGVYITQYSPEAFTALALSFPIQMVLVAVFVGLGVGINVNISKNLGEGNVHNASRASEHGFIIGTGLYLIVLLASFFVPGWYISLFTNNAAIIGYGTVYLSIIMALNFGRIYAQCCQSTFQGSGLMIFAMVVQISGALINIVLDPIFIFVLDLGVQGAAIATVIGQMSGMIIGLVILLVFKKGVPIKIKEFKFSFNMVKSIGKIGIPAAVMQGLGSVMMTILNLILASFSEAAITAYGIYFKLTTFVFMPVFGVAQGVLPITGFNFGARNRTRILSVVKYGIIYGTSFMFLGFLAFQFFPGQLISIFNPTPEVYDIAIVAVPTISYAFIFIATSIILASAFSGIGKPNISLLSSLLRQFIVLLPVAYILGNVFGIDYLWYSFLTAELISALFLIFKFRSTYRKELLHLDEEKLNI